MTEMMNEMTLTNEALESVNGGAIGVQTIGTRRTASLATLRKGASQKAKRIAMLPAGTVVLITGVVKKDKTYRYRLCKVKSTGMCGWIADSLLR